MTWDDAVLVFLNQDMANPFLDALMAAITVAAMPALGLLPFGLLIKGRRREGLAMAAVLALSILVAVGLQVLLARPRPVDVRAVLPIPATSSFPSGHAAAAMGCATLVALRWPRMGLPALGAAALVSLSRVYLGQHYPGDVLGGAILGATVAAVVYGFALSGTEPAPNRPALPAPRPPWVWLLWGQVGAVLLISLSAYLRLLSFGILSIPGMDKALHFLLVGGLALPAIGWWQRRPLAVLAILTLLVTFEEGLQALSPARSFDLLDLACALAGIALFGGLGIALARTQTPGIRA